MIKHVIHVATIEPGILPIIVDETVELIINQHVAEEINTKS
jgi:hypothetical protein